MKEKNRLATLQCQYEEEKWEVNVFSNRDRTFGISGRATVFNVYLKKTEHGYLVAIPNHPRCGYVPRNVNFGDVMEYVDIDNPIDASTLATGLRYLIEKMEAGELEVSPIGDDA